MEAQTSDKSAKKKSRIGRGQVGSVKIANDVVAMIAAMAAMEVEGVPSMAGGITGSAVGRLGRAKLARCVKVDVSGGEVRADLNVMLHYGYNIPGTCSKVQNRVRTAIENMTGLKVSAVNVNISEIVMPPVAGQN